MSLAGKYGVAQRLAQLENFMTEQARENKELRTLAATVTAELVLLKATLATADAKSTAYIEFLRARTAAMIASGNVKK
jgi:hypothetical protein